MSKIYVLEITHGDQSQGAVAARRSLVKLQKYTEALGLFKTWIPDAFEWKKHDSHGTHWQVTSPGPQGVSLFYTIYELDDEEVELKPTGLPVCVAHLSEMQRKWGGREVREKSHQEECGMCSVPAVPGRLCYREECKKPLHPNWPAVYCSNRCAEMDA